MELRPIQWVILQVLSCQSDGYLCSPDASAFKAEGLVNVEEVETALIDLQDSKLVEFYIENEEITVLKVERDESNEVIVNEDGTVNPVLDDEGKVQTEVITQLADSGWIITDKGRESLKTP